MISMHFVLSLGWAELLGAYVLYVMLENDYFNGVC